MDYQNILITGGAGFIGASLALKLKKDYPSSVITSFDNLVRRGSELNLPRLKKHGINFIHGDIRNKEDFNSLKQIDLMIECSAEPSVLAGLTNSPEYLINTNLGGAINCFEFSRKMKAHVVFLSSSRVYPIEKINNSNIVEDETRFKFAEKQNITGISSQGISEELTLNGFRSFYGASKLCSEFLIQEYIRYYKMKIVINRCGVVAGPWQMGKVDQGFITLWSAKHFFKKELAYIGYGGKGKQVRDIVHVDDLYDLIKIQLTNLGKYSGKIFNVGGGLNQSISLLELTDLCQKITGNQIKIQKILKNRPADLKIYISNCRFIESFSGWKPKKNIITIISDTLTWLKRHETLLKPVLS